MLRKCHQQWSSSRIQYVQLTILCCNTWNEYSAKLFNTQCQQPTDKNSKSNTMHIFKYEILLLQLSNHFLHKGKLCQKRRNIVCIQCTCIHKDMWNTCTVQKPKAQPVSPYAGNCYICRWLKWKTDTQHISSWITCVYKQICSLASWRVG